MTRRKAAESESTPSGRRYTCEVCGAIDVWREGWSSYGSQLDVEAERAVVTCPSDACKAEAPRLLRGKPQPPHRPFGYQ